jgi:segregation and condensation protein A
MTAADEISGDYQVRLSSFQGPLDLLLYLIRRAEVDIHDIPIHEITEQYFAYLGQIDRIDIDVAGEFLVMAATLIEIKSKTLAPKPEGGEGASEGESAADSGDPRFDLVRQLLEYQRYRSAAEELDRLRREYAERWAVRSGERPLETTDRSGTDGGEDDDEDDDESGDRAIEIEDAHILDLFDAYERIISAIDLTRLGEHRVEYDDTPITLHQEDLVDRLERSPSRRLTLRSAFEGRSRGEMIGLFLATLELARQGKVRIRQDEPGDEIELELAGEDAPASAPP